MTLPPELLAFLSRANTLMQQLEATLPPALPAVDWTATAFRWHSHQGRGGLVAVGAPHCLALDTLAGVEVQKAQLLRNTRQFVQGRSANNVLLTGARGTGKPSLVKALLPEFATQGLRLVEVDKQHLAELTQILDCLAPRPERFILFCDDLSFEEGDDAYKALKSALDGGLSRRADNVLVYATSNRRHLMPERMADNLGQRAADGEIHPAETVEEKVSLSERFGLWLSFYPFDQDTYLAAVGVWLATFQVPLDEAAQRAALLWSLTRGARSGRVAWQFACDWAGRTAVERLQG